MKTVQFVVNVTGSITQEKFEGLFEAKIFPSHRDTLREDEVRRSVLGMKSSEASEHAQSIATGIAFLTTRITKSPNWFSSSNNGIDLEDDNVLIEVHNACFGAITEEVTSLHKKAEEAKEKLKKHIEPTPVV